MKNIMYFIEYYENDWIWLVKASIWSLKGWFGLKKINFDLCKVWIWSIKTVTIIIAFQLLKKILYKK